MKIFFKLIFLFLMAQSIFAFEADRVIEGDNLRSIAERNIHRVLPRYSDINEYMNGIKNWNPRIKIWDNPPVGESVLVDYPYDLPKYVISDKVYTKKPTLLYSDDIGEKKLTTFLAFTNSTGTYTEKIGDTTVKSSQNFPITFGMSFSYKLIENEKYILSSFYYAYATKAQISQDGISSSTSVPGEIGFTFYFQKFIQNQFALYGGLDVEKLNSFNTADILNGADLTSTQYDVAYGTLGLSRNFTLYNIPMGVRGSFSQMMYSTLQNNKSLKGHKYILFYSIRPFGKINLNMFYKHHDLTGVSDLKIDRFGLGISFML